MFRVLPVIVAAGLFEDLVREASIPRRIGSLQKLARLPNAADEGQLYDTLVDAGWDFGMMEEYDNRFEDLVTKWIQNPDKTIRYYAVAWLFERQVSKSVSAILHLLENDRELQGVLLEPLRRRISDSFADKQVTIGISTGDPWSIAFVVASKNEQFLPLMIQLLDKGDCAAAERIILALGEMRNSSAVPVLLRQLARDSERRLFVPTLSALVKIGDPIVASKLLLLMEDAQPWKRIMVLDALAELSSEENIPSIRMFLDDNRMSSGRSVAGAAQEAILKIARRGDTLHHKQ
jgi:hypothetical protein